MQKSAAVFFFCFVFFIPPEGSHFKNKENNETKAFLSYSKLKSISIEQVKMV